MNKFLLLFVSGVLAGIPSFSGFTVGTRFPVSTCVVTALANITKSEQSSVSGNIQMTITITGLEQGEEAVLRIGKGTASLDIESALFEYQIKGTGGSLTEDITPILEDGYHLLLLEAPGQYFREPKGYLFNVRDSVVVNPTGKPITFALEPWPVYLAGYPAVEGVVGLSDDIPTRPSPILPRPLWQRLLEPSAILLSVIIVVAIGFIIWRRRSRVSH